MIVKGYGGMMKVKNEKGLVRFDIFMPAWA